MDPEEALKNAREKAKLIVNTDVRHAKLLEHAHDLAEAFLALDGWLSKGGFLPADWKKGRDVSDEPTKG